MKHSEMPHRYNIRSLLAALALATLVQIAAQAAEDPLKATLADDVIANHDLPTNVLVRTFWSAKVRGGIAIAGTCKSNGDPKISVHLAAGLSVQQALESMRSAAPGPLTWQTGDGVVDVALGGDWPPILDFPIDKFEWTSDASVAEAVGSLFQKLGVERRLKKLGLVPGLESWSILQAAPRVFNPPPSEPPDLWHIYGVSMLKALNGIIRHYPNASYWFYDERRCGAGGTYLVWAR